MNTLAALLLAVSFSPTADRTPPCQYEDGPGRCVWDARHMGNGEGDSFVMHKDGSVNYVTHRRAHRLMNSPR